MDKADLGTKRVCPNCGARFYDLSKRPIQCPKCAYSFEPEAMFKPRRRQADAVVAESETLKEETEEVVETADEDVELDTAEESSGHESDSDHHGAGMSVVDAEDVSIEDLDDDDVGEEEDDDTILSPDEDEDDDVSGIIDADIEKDEG